jgi:hypothetical protein
LWPKRSFYPLEVVEVDVTQRKRKRTAIGERFLTIEVFHQQPAVVQARQIVAHRHVANAGQRAFQLLSATCELLTEAGDLICHEQRDDEKERITRPNEKLVRQIRALTMLNVQHEAEARSRHVDTAIRRSRERPRCKAAKLRPSNVTVSRARRNGALPNVAVATQPRLTHKVTGSPNDAVVSRRRKSATIDNANNTRPTLNTTAASAIATSVVSSRPDAEPAHHRAMNDATPAPVSSDRRRRVTVCAT